MTKKPTWRLRRAVTISILVFCGVGMFYLFLFGEDTELNRLGMKILGGLAFASQGLYTGAKTWFNMKNPKPETVSEVE